MARILLIEDEEEVRLVIEGLLKAAGHDVLTAVDGIQGLKQFQSSRPDLVLTDLVMPNQDGIETIISLRMLSPKVAIIATSGKMASEASLSAARQLGALSILEKPFSIDQLLSAIDNA